MKKLISIFLFAALCCPTLLMSQSKDNITNDAKIDSIYRLQKKMYAESKAGPLANKKYGVELNLFRFLLIDQATTFSGTFSLFKVNKQVEIAFPIYYQAPKNADDLKELTLDCHYRYFLGDVLNGFYFSAFTRVAYLSGTIGDNGFFETNSVPQIHDTQTKVGLGFGIGYRKFSRKNLYWGTSLSLGRYITGKNDHFKGDFLTFDDDQPIIVDFEFLKFGWAF